MNILVTGASKGIGYAIRERLYDSEMQVYNYSRSTDVDLSTEEGITFALEHMDHFDVLINNFGGGGTWQYPDWKSVMENNYGVALQLTERFIQKKRDWGRVITISSIHGKEKGHNPWFTAAKAAQIALMKSYAGKHPGITFNTICPGHIDVGKPFPYKPKVLGHPEDVANLVNFLISDEAEHINGATITVDGGESHSF